LAEQALQVLPLQLTQLREQQRFPQSSQLMGEEEQE
jgi:hypothetical protein